MPQPDDDDVLAALDFKLTDDEDLADGGFDWDNGLPNHASEIMDKVGELLKPVIEDLVTSLNADRGGLIQALHTSTGDSVTASLVGTNEVRVIVQLGEGRHFVDYSIDPEDE